MTTTARATTKSTTTGRRGKSGPWPLALALVASALFGGACSRAHLSSNYGLAYNAWFSAQHVRQEPSDSEATKRALGGLDAQEAASISKNYRKNTSGQGDTTGQAQMVMIGQTRSGNDSYTPPPSVPGGN